MKNNDSVRVWDPFVRIFHWGLVLSFLLAYVTEEDILSIHTLAGYVVIGLLFLRIIWGFIGTRYAKFSEFAYAPSTIYQFLVETGKFRAPRYLGHNPAGGAMIVALLVMLAVIGISGHLMLTERYFGVKWLEEVHETAVDITLILIALHIVRVLLSSLVHRENLIKSMLTGLKRPATGPTSD